MLAVFEGKEEKYWGSLPWFCYGVTHAHPNTNISPLISNGLNKYIAQTNKFKTHLAHGQTISHIYEHPWPNNKIIKWIFMAQVQK